MKNYIKIPNKRYEINDDYFSKIDSNEKAYWLGFLYADGYVRMHNGRSGELKLKLSVKDEEHLEKFKNSLASTHPIKKAISKVIKNDKISISNCISISIYNTKIVLDLFKLGCINNKTFKTKFPINDCLKNKYKISFIRGLFDGDGCIYKSKMGNTNCFILGTFDILNSISEILSKKNINCTIKKYGNIYRLNICGGKFGILKFKNLLYYNSNIHLERKKCIFESIEYIDKRCKII